jgi:hypothetical protein
MHDTPTRRYGPDFPPELRALDNLEVSLGSLAASLEHATPLIEGLQRQHAELTATVFSRLGECDPEEAISAVRALKGAVERNRQS